MDLVPHLFENALAEARQFPHRFWIHCLLNRYVDGDLFSSRKQIEVLSFCEVVLDIKPIGEISGGVVHDQRNRHWLSKPKDEVGSGDTKRKETLPRLDSHSRGCLQLHQDLTFLNLPSLIEYKDFQVDPVVVDNSLDRVTAQKSLSFNEIDAQVRDYVLSSPAFSQDVFHGRRLPWRLFPSNYHNNEEF